MRSKLTVQISALNAFMGGLAVASPGRMEPMIRRIHDLLDEQVKMNMAVAESVLSASGDRGGSDEGWARLEFNLTTEGIPLEYFREYRRSIETVLQSVVDSNHLAGHTSDLESSGGWSCEGPQDSSIHPRDSASQLQVANRLRRKMVADRIQSGEGRSNGGSRRLSAEEEKKRVLVLNLTGLDVRHVRSRAESQGFGKLFSRLSTTFMLQGNAVCSAASYRRSSKPLKLLLDSGCEPTSY